MAVRRNTVSIPAKAGAAANPVCFGSPSVVAGCRVCGVRDACYRKGFAKSVYLLPRPRR